MTDATAGRGGVGIRLFVQGDAVVRRTFDQVADSGKKMWAEIALGERSANPAIRALSVGAGEARGAVDGLAGRAGPAGSVLSAFGAAGVAAAAALGGLGIALSKVREGMAFAADLTDAADRIGIGAEALQEWRYVADEAGVSVETFQANLERLNGQVGAFKVGIGDARLKPIFEELGITKDQLQNVTNAQDMMLLLADTLGQIKDRAVQVRLAKGLGVEESLPILRLGSEEIRKLSADARDLGLVMSDEVRTELDEADRALERASQRIDMEMRVAVAGLADDFTDLVSVIADAMSKLNGFLDVFKNWRTQANAIYGDNFVDDLLKGDSAQAFGSAWRSVTSGRAFRAARQIRDGDSLAGDWDIDEVEAGLRALAKPEPKPNPDSGFDPQGHTSSGGGGSSSSAAAARRAEREAEQRRQREERAADQQARLTRDLDRAWNQSGHMQTIEGRAAAEISDLERERADRLKDIKRAEEEYVRSGGLRGLTAAEAELLRGKTEELIAVKQSLVSDQERRDLTARRLEKEQEAAEYAIELLDIDSQMATTARERHRIEREILLATIEMARKRRSAELENDPEYSEEDRRQLLDRFDRNASRQVELIDYRESERLRQQFKGYGREVVDAIREGRIGEYIADQLRERLTDGFLDMLFNSAGGKKGGGGWLSGAFDAVAGWFKFGGGRAGGGSAEAGRAYVTTEHGRPELFMLGGQGQVTSAAETVRMLDDAFASRPSSQGDLTLNMPDINLYAPGADAAALARLEAEVRALRGEMPGIAVRAVAEAKQRRVLS